MRYRLSIVVWLVLGRAPGAVGTADGGTAVVGVGRAEEEMEEMEAEDRGFVLTVSFDGSADDRGGVGGGGVDAAEEELDCGDVGDPDGRGRRVMGTLDCMGFDVDASKA